MNLQAMTKEKLQFLLPVVFTVGPDVNSRGANSRVAEDAQQQGQAQEDRGDALMKYAMLLTDTNNAKAASNTTQFLGNIVKGIIEGETRVLVSSMTMEEIFTEREEFSKSPSLCGAKRRLPMMLQKVLTSRRAPYFP